jgi:hypothetical protein
MGHSKVATLGTRRNDLECESLRSLSRRRQAAGYGQSRNRACHVEAGLGAGASPLAKARASSRTPDPRDQQRVQVLDATERHSKAESVKELDPAHPPPITAAGPSLRRRASNRERVPARSF